MDGREISEMERITLHYTIHYNANSKQVNYIVHVSFAQGGVFVMQMEILECF